MSKQNNARRQKDISRLLREKKRSYPEKLKSLTRQPAKQVWPPKNFLIWSVMLGLLVSGGFGCSCFKFSLQGAVPHYNCKF